MRASKVMSISVPPVFFDQIRKIAGEEGRTLSELLREALRQYIALREWREIQRYGAFMARKKGISEEKTVTECAMESDLYQNLLNLQCLTPRLSITRARSTKKEDDMMSDEGNTVERNEFKDIVDDIREAFRKVFKEELEVSGNVEGRVWGQSGRAAGISDGAKGVQWSAGVFPTLECFLFVNLEGNKYGGDWPLVRFMSREFRQAELFQFLSSLDLELKEKTKLNLYREAWQHGSRVPIKGKDILPNISLSELTPESWHKALDEGLHCYKIDKERVAKDKKEVTFAVNGQKEVREVSAHLEFINELNYSSDSCVLVKRMNDIRQRIQPLYDFVRSK
ncbi:MAG: ribbon-helix-helix protein, CopG family [bacterium]